MTTRFADTFFFIALLNRRDQWHANAVEFSTQRQTLVTTVWVLTELADGLASVGERHLFPIFLERLQKNPNVLVLEPHMDVFVRAVDLYKSRPDKQWSLTDCVSFVAMAERGIHEALTGDHHFEQAGFTPLFKK